ncbi:MAG: insulinase family protein [Deltaproteobacteria bacterium]|nr:insulinase family protein [Deltaproteobacteria bacterium]
MKLRSFLLAVVLLCLPVSVQALGIDAKMVKQTLPNGIKVFIYHRDTSPTISFYIGHKVGGVDGELTGAAHFLEHLLFKGTANVGSLDFRQEEKILQRVIATGDALDEERAKGTDTKQIAQLEKRLTELTEAHRQFYRASELARIYIENGATDFNASTGVDFTFYMVSLPKDKLELWARVEADRRKNPLFRDFYAERSVVAQERVQRTESVPDGMLMELFLATAFTAHPYRNPTVGWMDDINALSHTYMRQYFENFYAPQNTVIVLVGDVNAPEALAVITRYLGDIPPRKVVRKNIVVEPLQRGEKRAELALDANEKLYIGFHKPTYPHKDNYAFEIMENILTSGRSSRLHRSLIERTNPLAQSVEAANGLPGVRYNNLFCIFATPLAAGKLENLEVAITDELAQLAQNGIEEAELQKAKNSIRFNFFSRLETNNGLASLLAYSATVFGDTASLDHYLEEIEQVRTEDVQRVAREYLTKENRTVVMIKREK